MSLDEYLQKKGSPSLVELADRAGVSYTTLKGVRRGMKLKLYEIAKKISDATNGAVTIEELCE